MTPRRGTVLGSTRTPNGRKRPHEEGATHLSMWSGSMPVCARFGRWWRGARRSVAGKPLRITSTPGRQAGGGEARQSERTGVHDAMMNTTNEEHSKHLHTATGFRAGSSHQSRQSRHHGPEANKPSAKQCDLLTRAALTHAGRSSGAEHEVDRLGEMALQIRERETCDRSGRAGFEAKRFLGRDHLSHNASGPRWSASTTIGRREDRCGERLRGPKGQD